MRQVVAAVGLLGLAVSCDSAGGGALQPLADHTAEQRQIWSLAPASTIFGLTVARLDHLFERLGALREAARTGPHLRKVLDEQGAELTQKVGFDPFLAESWRARGLDLAGPLGFFLLDKEHGVVVVRATDPGRAVSELTTLIHKGGSPQDIGCAAAQGSWVVCGNAAPQALAKSESASVWPELQRDQSAADLRADIQSLLAFDRGPLADELGAKSSADATDRYFASSKSLFISVTLAADQIFTHGWYKNPQSALLQPYFRQEPGTKSLLGMGVGAHSVARLLLSAQELWRKAESTLERSTLDRAAAGFQVTTGLDLKKDLVDNLSGEMVFLDFGSSMGSGTWSWVLGTRDDAKTQRLAERIDQLASAGLATARSALKDSGWSLGHSVDTVGGRTVYVYKADVPADTAKQLGTDHWEVQLAALPGALALSLDRKSLERLVANAGKSREALMAEIPSVEARRAFGSDIAFASWGMMPADVYGQLPKFQRQLVGDLGRDAKIPDLGETVHEGFNVLSLIFDAMTSCEVKPDGISVTMQYTLL
jgi:hypothetical protein